MSGLRDIYDHLESVVAPAVAEFTRSDDFTRICTVVGAVDTVIRSRASDLTAELWHRVNLPAGTDVQRLRRQIGDLDRQLRNLVMELEAARRMSTHHGRHGDAHD